MRCLQTAIYEGVAERAPGGGWRVFHGLKFFAVVFLLSVFGAAAEGPGRFADGRDVRFSQWQADAPASAPARVGNFSVMRPPAEKLLAGWRKAAWARALDDVKNALPADNAADWLRQSAREKWLYNRDAKTLSQWWRDVRRQNVGLNLLQRTADFGAGEWLNALEHNAGGMAFVRALEVDFTPALGERRWQLGLNAVGGFRETDDDVLAWQLRAYGSQKSSRGGNVGLIYRRIPAAAAGGLAGVNVFFDYEHHGGYDEWFTRWSLGAEYRAGWGGLDVNWYFPLRDVVERADAYIYSRRGWDARLLLAGPAAWVDGALTYYHWRGRFGDDSDKGLRYGLRFSPPAAPGLRLDVEYDAGDKARQWSGHLSWLYRINEAQVAAPAARTAAAFDARENFYNPVRREYGQRIRLVEKDALAGGAALFVTLTAVRGEGVGRAPGLTLTAATALAGVQLTGARVTAGGEAVSWRVAATATVFSAGGSEVSLAAGAPAPWALMMNGNTGIAFLDGGRQIYILTGTVRFSREGAGVERILTPGAILRLLGTTINVGWDGVQSHVTLQRGVASLSFLDERAPLPSDLVITILRATLRQVLPGTTLPGGSVAADPAPATVSIRYHSTALRGIVPDKAVATLLIPPRPGIRVSLLNATPPLVLAAAQAGVIATVTATGGNPPLRYRLAAGSVPVLVTAGGEVLLSLAAGLGAPRDVAVTIFADDANEPPNIGEYGFGLLTYADVAADGVTATVAANATGEVGVIAAAGGDGAYAYALNADDAALELATETHGGGRVGVLRLASPLGASRPLEATVIVTDGIGGRTEAPVRIVSRSLPSLDGGLRTLGATQSGAVYTLQATGGDGVYSYALATGTDARVSLSSSDTDADGRQNAVLSLTAGLGGDVVLEVAVSVTDGDNLSAGAIVTLSAHAGLLAAGVTTTLAADDTGAVGTISAQGGGGAYAYALNTGNPALALATETSGGANVGALRLIFALGASETLDAMVIVTDEVGGRVEVPVRIVSRSLPSLPGGARTLGATQSGNVFTLTATGGDETYTYALAAGTDAGVSLSASDTDGDGKDNAILSLTAALGDGVALTVTLTVTDGDSLSDSAVVTLSAHAGLLADGVTATVAANDTGPVGTINAQGGGGAYTYALNNAALALATETSGGINVGVLRLVSTLGASQTLDAMVTVTDEVGGTVKASVRIVSRSLPSLDGGLRRLGATESGAVFTLQATGGDEAYTYSLAADSDARAALAQEDAGGGLRRAVLSLTDALGGEVVLTVTIGVTDGDELSDAATVTLSTYAALAAAGFSVEVASDDTGEVGVISADGGDGVYTFALNATNAALALRTEERGGENVGVVVLDSALGASQTAEATVTVTDGVGGTVEATVTISSRSLPELAGGLRRLGATESGDVFTLTATGGDGAYSYALAAGTNASVVLAASDTDGDGKDNAILSLTAALGDGVALEVEVSVTDGDGLSASGIVTLSAHAGLLADGVTATVAADDTGPVGTINAQGGGGAYTYALNNATLALATETSGGINVGVLRLVSTLGASQTLDAMVTVTDEVGGTVKAPVRIVSRSLPSLDGGLRRLGATESGAVFTLQAAGGDGAYTYALAAGTNASVELATRDTDGDSADNAVLSLPAALGGDVMLLVTVSVTDGDGLQDSGIVTLSTHAALAAAGFSVEVASNDTGEVSIVAADGGDGVYAFALHAGSAALALRTEERAGENVGVLVLNSALGASQTAEATVTVTDGVGGTVEALVTISSRSLPSLPGGLHELGATQSGNVYTLTATGGDEAYTYALAAGTDARVSLSSSDTDGDGKDNAILSLTAALGDGVALTVTIGVTDGDGLSDNAVVTLSAHAGLLADGVTATVAADDTGAVGTINAQGGDGAYTYALNTGNPALVLATETSGGVNVGALRLATTLGASQVLEATVTVMDEVGGRIETPVRIVSRSLPELAGGLRELGATQSGDVFTLQATGGDGAYTYALAAGTDARVALAARDTDSDGADNAVLSLPNALGGDVVLQITFTVTDGDGLSDSAVVTLSSYAALAAAGFSVEVASDDTGEVSIIAADGGNGVYAFALNADNTALALRTEERGGENVGVVVLNSALGASQTAEATVTVTDGVGGTVEALVTVSSRSLPELDGGLRRLGSTESGAVFTLQAAGGDGSYSYAAAADTDARIALAEEDAGGGLLRAVLSLTDALGGDAVLLVTISVTDGDDLSDSGVVTLSSYAALAAAGFSVEIASDDTGAVGVIAPAGGDGVYTYSLNADNATLTLATVSGNAELRLTAALGAEEILTATVTVEDGVGGEVVATITVTTRSLPELDGGLRRLGSTESGAVFTLQAAGGDGSYSYALAADSDARAALAEEDAGGGLRRAVLSLPDALDGEVALTVTIGVTDGDGLQDSGVVTLSTYAALAAAGFSVEVASDDTGEVGVIAPTGGDGVYAYALSANNVTLATVAGEAELRLTAALGASQTLEATVTVTDGVGGTVEALVTISSRSLPSLPGGARMLGATQSGNVFTLTATGGDGAYSYALATGTDAHVSLSESDTDGDGKDNAILSLTAALGDGVALTVTIGVTDGDGLSDSAVVTLSAHAGLLAEGVTATVAADDTGPVGTINAQGGGGAYTYALNTGNPALVLATETSGGVNVGALRLVSTLGASQTLDAMVTVTDEVGGTVKAPVRIVSRSLPSLDGGLRRLGATESGAVFTLQAAGGDGAYTYSLAADSDARAALAEEDAGGGLRRAVLSLTDALGGDVSLLVTIGVTDGDELSDTGIVTLSSYAVLAADGVTATVAADDTGEVGVIAADGGDGVYSFALNAGDAVLALSTEARGGENVGVLRLVSTLGASGAATAAVRVTDGVSGAVDVLVTVSSRSLPELDGGDVTLGATESGAVFTLQATGGDEDYSYTLAAGTDARAALAQEDAGGGLRRAVLSLPAALGGDVSLEVEVSVTDGDDLSDSAVVTLSTYAALSASGFSVEVASDDTGEVGVISADGGDGVYTFALNATNAALALRTEERGGENVGVVVLNSTLGASQTAEATVTVTDGAGGTVTALVTISSRSLPSLLGGTRTLGATQSGNVFTLTATGGDGAYTYSLAATTDARVSLSASDTDGDGKNNAVLSLTAELGDGVALNVQVSVTDGDGLSASGIVTLSSHAGLLADGVTATVAANDTGPVGTISAQGGGGAYTYALNNATLALATETSGGINVGVLRLVSTLGASQTLDAMVTVTDEVGGTVKAPVRIVSRSLPSLDGGLRRLGATESGAVYTLQATGGDGSYSYALATGTNASVVLAEEDAGGGLRRAVLSLPDALGGDISLTVTIGVTDGDGLSDSATVTLSSYAVLAAAGFSVEVASDDTGEVGVISADGGDGVYTFALNSGNAALALRTEERGGENVGVVVLDSALGASQTAEATVTVTDGVSGTVEVLVTVSSRSLPELDGGLRRLGSTESGAVFTLQAVGGDGSYSYAAEADTNASVELAQEDAGGGLRRAVLSLPAALGGEVVLLVTIGVTDGDGLQVSATVTLSTYAVLAAAGFSVEVASDDTGEAGVISADGGDGVYTFALNATNAALALRTEERGGENVGVVVLNSALGASETAEATVTVTDGVGGTVEALVTVSSRSLPELDGGLRRLGATESGAVFTLQAAGGDADYSYTLAADTDARIALAQEDAGGGLRRAVLSLPAALGGEVVLLVTVSVTDGDDLSDSAVVTLSSYAALAAAGFSVEVASDDTGEAGVIAADGGDGVYTFALHADNAALALRTEERSGENVGVVVLDSALGASETAEATVTVTDGVGGTVEATVTISSRSLPVLDGGDVTLGATESGAVFTLQATGGDADYSYTLAAGTDARAALAQEDAGGGLRRAVLSLPAALGGEVVLLVTVSVTDGDELSDTGIVTLSSYAALAASGFSVEVASDDTGEAGVISADGGDGVYTFALHADNAALALRMEERGGENVGVVVLDSALGASETAEATVTVTDSVGGTVEALVTISSRSLPVLDGGLRALGATESGAVFTLQATGGDADYSYTLAAGTDARAALAQEDAGGGLRRAVLSLPAALGGDVSLTVTVSVTDGDDLSDSAVVTLSAYAALAAAGFSVEVASDDTGEAGVISADGGDGVYTFALHADNAALALRTEERGGENVGVVVLNSALGASQTAEATVTVTDGVGGTVEALVTISSRSLPVLDGGLRALGATESGAVFTLQAAGGDADYSYTLAAGTDARAVLAQEDAGGGLRRAVLSLPAALGGEVALLVTVSVTDGDELSDSGVVTLSSYAELAAAGFSVEIASDDTGAVGVIAPAGGDGVYAYALHAENPALTLATVSGNAELRLTAALGAEQILTATVTVTDGVSGEVEALLTVTTRSLPVLDGGLRTLGATESGAVYTLQATGGDETYTYSLAADSDARVALAQEDAGGGLRRAVLSLPAALGGEVLLPVTISVTDGDDISDTGIVTLTTYATLSASGVTVTIGASIFGAAATLSASGADGVFAYSLNADNATLTLVPATDAAGVNIAVLSVTAGLGESLAVRATAIITDGVFGRRELSVLVTTRRNPFLFSDDPFIIITGGVVTGRISRGAATHGDGNYRYHIKAGHDARFALSAAVVFGRPGYHLNVTAPLGEGNAFLLTVVVTDGDGATAEGRYQVTTYPPLDFGEDETVIITPEESDIVHLTPVAGGNGIYSFRKVSGDARVEVINSARSGFAALRLAAPLGENQTAGVEIEVTDSIGSAPDTKRVTLVTFTRFLAAGVTMTVGADTEGMIARLPVSGGDLAYQFSLLDTDDERLTLAVVASAVPAAYVSLTAPLGGGRRVQAQAFVRDGQSSHTFSPHIRIETREALTIPAGRLVTLGATQAGTVVYRGAASGGDGDYAYSLNSDDARLVLLPPRTPGNDTDDALLSVSAGLGGEVLLTATLTARDGGGRDGHYSAAQALMTISTYAALRADGVTLTISGLRVGALATITASGGTGGGYTYNLISDNVRLRIDDAGVLMVNPQLFYEKRVSATAVIGDGVVSVSAAVLISTYAALALEANQFVTLRHDAQDVVLTLTASGGVGDYSYGGGDIRNVLVVTQPNPARGGIKEGGVVFLNPLGYSRVSVINFFVEDGEGRRSAVQVRFTTYARLQADGVTATVAWDETGIVGTITATGGNGVYTYDSDNDALAVDDEGALSLTAALGDSGILTAMVTVSDGVGYVEEAPVSITAGQIPPVALPSGAVSVRADFSGAWATVQAIAGDGDYTYGEFSFENLNISLIQGDANGDGLRDVVLSLRAPLAGGGDETVLLQAQDGTGAPPVSGLWQVSAYATLSLEADITARFAPGAEIAFTLQAFGGRRDAYVYDLAPGSDSRLRIERRDTDGDGIDNAVLSADAIGADEAGARVRVRDGTGAEDLRYVALAATPLTLADFARRVRHLQTGAVATMRASGGFGDYTYSLTAHATTRMRLRMEGGAAIIDLTLGLLSRATVVGTVTARDEIGGVASAVISITTSRYVRFDPVRETVTVTAGADGAVFTLQAEHGDMPYRYELLTVRADGSTLRTTHGAGITLVTLDADGDALDTNNDGTPEVVLSLITALAGGGELSITIQARDANGLADGKVARVTAYQALALAGARVDLPASYTGVLRRGAATGGGDQNYRYALRGADARFSLRDITAGGNRGYALLLNEALGGNAQATVTVVAEDGVNQSAEAVFEISTYAPLRADGASVVIGGREADVAAVILPSGGDGNYSYDLLTDDDRLTVVTVNGNAALSLTAFLDYENLLEATLTVSDGAGSEVLAEVRITTRSLLSLGDDIAVTIGARTYGDVHTLRAQGGAGDYTYEKREGSDSVSLRQQTNADTGAREAVLSVPSQLGLGGSKTLPIRVRVTDGAGERDSADITVTTRAFLRLGADETITVAAGRAIEIYTLQATGGDRENYIYVSDNDSQFVISRQEDTDGDGANNAVLSLATPLEAVHGEREAIVVVSDGDFGAHATRKVYISAYERLSADGITLTVAHNFTGEAGRLRAAGGDGDYRYSLHSDNNALSVVTKEGAALLNLRATLGEEQLLSATVTVFDGAGSLPVEAAVVISSRAALTFEKGEVRLHRVVGFRDSFYDAEVTGGDGDYRYALEGMLNPDGSVNRDFIYRFIGFSEGDRNGNGLRDARLAVNRGSPLIAPGREITLTINARDGGGLSAAQTVRLMHHPLLAVAPGDVGRIVGYHVSGGLVTLRLSGGVGSYLYAFHSDDERLRILSAQDPLISELDDSIAISNYADELASGEVRLGSDTLTLELTEALGPEVRLSATLTAFGSIEGTDIIAIRITSAAVLNLPAPATIAADAPVEQGRALHTLTADGGIGNYAYAIAGAVPASATAYVAINAAGEISQAKQIAAPFTATITFRVDSGSETAQEAVVLDWRAQNFAAPRGQLFIIGGEEADSSDTNTFADVWVSESDNTSWAELTVSTVLQPRRTFSKRITRAAALNNTVYVIGGRIGRSRSGGETTGEVWSSTDGRIWIPRLTAAFLNRDGHQVLTHRGSLYVIGGAAGDAPAGDNAIWASADGINWQERNRNTPAEDNLPPIFKHGAASHNGTLFVVGGDPNIGGAPGANLDVWASADDGATWATVARFSGSLIYPNVVSYRGVLYVIGGGRHDVWWSVDGRVWDKHPDFPSAGHRNAVSDAVALWRGDELLLIGGRRFNQRVRDIYSTTDGKTWTHEGTHPFTARSGAGFALFEPRASVEDLSAPGVARRVRIRQTGAVATVRATGGYGDHTYVLFAQGRAEEMQMVTVNGAAVINLTGALGPEATAAATVIVQDGLRWRVDAVVSLTTAPGIILGRQANITVTAGATGAVFTVQAEDGDPPYVYFPRPLPGSITLITTDADGDPLDINGDGARDAVVSLTAPLAAGAQVIMAVIARDANDSLRDLVEQPVVVSAWTLPELGEGARINLPAQFTGNSEIGFADGGAGGYRYTLKGDDARFGLEDIDVAGKPGYRLIINEALGENVLVTLTVMVTDRVNQTAETTFEISTYAALRAAGVTVTTGGFSTGEHGTITPTGSDGNYRYALNSDNEDLRLVTIAGGGGGSAVLSLRALLGREQVLLATVTVTDGFGFSVDAPVRITTRERLHIFSPILITLPADLGDPATYADNAIYTMTARGGDIDYSWSFGFGPQSDQTELKQFSVPPINLRGILHQRGDQARIIFREPYLPAGETERIVLAVSDGSGEIAFQVFVFTVQPPLVFSGATVTVGATYTGPLATLQATGGDDTYLYGDALVAGFDVIRERDNNGDGLQDVVFLATRPAGGSRIVTLTAQVNAHRLFEVRDTDLHEQHWFRRAPLVISTYAALTADGVDLTISQRQVGGLAVIAPSGGDGNYAYAIHSDDDRLTLAAQPNGNIAVRLTTRLDYGEQLAATVTVTDGAAGVLAVPVRISVYERLALGEVSFVPLEPDATGIVFTLTATGGDGNYRFTQETALLDGVEILPGAYETANEVYLIVLNPDGLGYDREITVQIRVQDGASGLARATVILRTPSPPPEP